MPPEAHDSPASGEKVHVRLLATVANRSQLRPRSKALVNHPRVAGDVFLEPPATKVVNDDATSWI